MITVVDIQTNNAYSYGEGQGFDRRIFLIYDGVHYDGEAGARRCPYRLALVEAPGFGRAYFASWAESVIRLTPISSLRRIQWRRSSVNPGRRAFDDSVSLAGSRRQGWSAREMDAESGSWRTRSQGCEMRVPLEGEAASLFCTRLIGSTIHDAITVEACDVVTYRT